MLTLAGGNRAVLNSPFINLTQEVYMYSDAMYLLELLVAVRHNSSMTYMGYSNPVIVQALIVKDFVEVLSSLEKNNPDNGDFNFALKAAAEKFGHNFADEWHGLVLAN